VSFVSFAFAALYLFALGLRLTIGWSKQSRIYLISLLVLSVVFYGWHIPEFTWIIVFPPAN
jgi:hypothetical protein